MLLVVIDLVGNVQQCKYGKQIIRVLQYEMLFLVGINRRRLLQALGTGEVTKTALITLLLQDLSFPEINSDDFFQNGVLFTKRCADMYTYRQHVFGTVISIFVGTSIVLHKLCQDSLAIVFDAHNISQNPTLVKIQLKSKSKFNQNPPKLV